MHFLLTRPIEDSDRLAARLTALGHDVTCEPLLDITFEPAGKIDLEKYQALLFTSANGVRAYYHQYDFSNPRPDIPCYAVGAATAEEARQNGFHRVIVAGGDVNRLARLVIQDLDPDAGPLLHISGKQHTGNLAGQIALANFNITTAKLYRATQSTALTAATQTALAFGRISHIPFYSPRTAKTFVTLIQQAGCQDLLTEITALCLSSAITDVISCLDWQQIETAPHPDQHSLFQMIDINIKGSRQ